MEDEAPIPLPKPQRRRRRSRRRKTPLQRILQSLSVLAPIALLGVALLLAAGTVRIVEHGAAAAAARRHARGEAPQPNVEPIREVKVEYRPIDGLPNDPSSRLERETRKVLSLEEEFVRGGAATQAEPTSLDDILDWELIEVSKRSKRAEQAR